MMQNELLNQGTDLHAFVRNLPDVDRRVLMLHYAEDLTSQEIAMILGLGISQVENRIVALRAIAKAVVQTSTLSKAG